MAESAKMAASPKNLTMFGGKKVGRAKSGLKLKGDSESFHSPLGSKSSGGKKRRK